jgi:hypothetical protein
MYCPEEDTIVNENKQEPGVERRRADEDHELTDQGVEDEKQGHSSLLQEIESGLAAAVELNANGGNPDTPATIGQSGMGTPNRS